MTWTKFNDMHSGGGQKEDFDCCYIEAPQAQAEVIFYNRFGHSPNRVTCTCCGEDYSVSESENLKQATGYERNCGYDKSGYIEKARDSRKFVTLEEYVKKDDVLIIHETEIKPEERIGEVRQQGYVWMD